MDDSIRGPLKLSFVSSKGAAKFNTIEIKDAAGASVVSFSASELADAFSAAAAARAGHQGAANLARPVAAIEAERENDLIRRMSLAEKVGQLQGG